MDNKELALFLEKIQTREVTIEDGVALLKSHCSAQMDYAHLDCNRQKRTGVPEVIFGENKTVEQIVGIMAKMMGHDSVVLATRVDQDKADGVCEKLAGITYHAEARMLSANQNKANSAIGKGTIMLVTAGTSDMEVAEEAYWTARYLGHEIEKKYDVGVAGIHRLFSCLKELQRASVIIVVAGMEGALPSVVAGLVEGPVIAVPTSVGYGVGAGGVAALLGMLNSCSPGVAVVNIDNGFGAACMAAAINRK